VPPSASTLDDTDHDQLNEVVIMADKSLDHSAFSSNNNLQQAEDLWQSHCMAIALKYAIKDV
jgi:hypothetical protein